MNDMTPAGIGHNGPPDPIEVVMAEYDATISEAQNWADGEPVSDQSSMESVDAILKEFKSYKTALTKAGKERTDPLHKAWKSEVAAVKIYLDDAAARQSTLVACVAPYKKKLADEKAEQERLAWEETNRLRREAEAREAEANEASIEDQREIMAAKQAVIDAEKAAKAAKGQAPKGMRTVTHHEITSMRDVVNWIARQDKDAMAEFATEYVRRNHKGKAISGVRVWQEKEAF